MTDYVKIPDKVAQIVERRLKGESISNIAYSMGKSRAGLYKILRHFARKAGLQKGCDVINYIAYLAGLDQGMAIERDKKVDKIHLYTGK